MEDEDEVSHVNRSEQVDRSMEEKKKLDESEERGLSPQHCDVLPEMKESEGVGNSSIGVEDVRLMDSEQTLLMADDEEEEEEQAQVPATAVEEALDMVEEALLRGGEVCLIGGEEATPIVEREANSVFEREAPSIVEEDVVADDTSKVAEDPSVFEKNPLVAEEDTSLGADEGVSKTAEEAPPVVAEVDTPMVAEEAPSVVAEEAPSVVVEEAPPVVAEEAPPVVAEVDTPMVADGAVSKAADEAFSKVAEEAPLVVAEEAPLVVAEEDTSMVADGALSKVAEQAPSVDAEEGTTIAAEESPLLVAEEIHSNVAEEAKAIAAEESPTVEGDLMAAQDDAQLIVVGDASMAAQEDPSVVAEESPSMVAEESPSMVAEKAPVVVAKESPAMVGEEAPLVVEEEAPPEPEIDAEMEADEEANAEMQAEAEVEAEVEVEVEDEMEMATEVTEAKMESGGKRKRGRPPKVLKVQTKSPPKRTVEKRTIENKTTEEDVCFICFDGGEIVLCDRRGCPKAYHPACINRDDTFFRSKGRWTCGWHICSNCEKAAQYMCYTCTYSLCKGCIKEADIFCVRGNKGFCETCKGTVMLIEKNVHGNKETPQVDFDDKSSWEYLFKEYWIDLKGKLCLTSDEIMQAKNPWKGSNASVRKEESSEELYNANDHQGSDSDSSSGHVELSSSRKRKAKSRSKSSKEEASSSVTQAAVSEGTSTSKDAEWASEELLELVAHMKNGDKSFISQFDVQALLLEYIKQNNLRDPRRKSQIVCDSRLANLFGKPRVGHFEMLKLLESHFIVKEDAQADDIQVGNVNTEANHSEADGSSGGKKDKRRKTRKKGDEREPQTNLDDYAAIDVHNIKLLFLRRNLMEDLLEDSDKFQNMVVGSFVRIRISGSGQKQDMYRLVQVIGTRKAAEPYKTGKRTADVVLEILNLNKTEAISIDTISNQEFSEDECKRLRQSIKCGLINRMTVGEVQDKAMTLHAVRANDMLETEKLRITHLRDRASEQGRKKDLRECVEKLQLLNTPEERSRRLQEIPKVHADPNMDPNYESEDEEQQDDRQQDMYVKSRGFSRKGREPISPGKGSSPSVDSWSGTRKYAATGSVTGRNTPTKGFWDKGDGARDGTNEFSWSQGKDAHQSNSWEKNTNQARGTGLDTNTWSGQADGRSGSSSTVAPETALAPFATAVAQSSNVSETDKIWQYTDPSGKIQGPFSMVQLRKWSTTGYFPDHLRIWRITENADDSILLNDALVGKFSRELPQIAKGTVVSENIRENNGGSGWEGGNNSAWTDKNQVVRSWNSNGNDASHKITNGDGWGPGSFGRTASRTDPRGEASRVWDSSKGNSALFAQSQVHSPHQQPGGQSGGRWNHGNNQGNTLTTNRPTARANNWGPSVEAPKFAAEGWGVDQSNRNISSSLPSPTPKASSSSWPSETSQDFSSPPTPTPGPTNVFDPHKQVGVHSPIVPGIVAANNPMVTPPPNMIGQGVSAWGSSGPEENHGWGSSSTPKLPSPTPGSTPVFVAQNPTANDPTAPNSGSMPASNYAGPPNMNNQNIPVVNQWNSGPNVQPHVPVNPGWGTGANQNPGPAWGPPPQENQTAGWMPSAQNANIGWGGPVQGNAAMGWGAAPPANPNAIQGTMPQGNTNMGWGPPAGDNTGMRINQSQHGGERHSGRRDWNSHGGDSGGHGGRRPSYNRQSSFGSGGGRGPNNRPQSKRPGVCRFHESGHCRKGAECDYHH